MLFIQATRISFPSPGPFLFLDMHVAQGQQFARESLTFQDRPHDLE